MSDEGDEWSAANYRYGRLMGAWVIGFIAELKDHGMSHEAALEMVRSTIRIEFNIGFQGTDVSQHFLRSWTEHSNVPEGVGR